jgi:hypothetical protein
MKYNSANAVTSNKTTTNKKKQRNFLDIFIIKKINLI